MINQKSPTPLSRRHNNGQYVFLDGEGFLQKPRTVFWEWLFLDSASPLSRIDCLKTLSPLFSTNIIKNEFTSGRQSSGRVKPFEIAGINERVNWIGVGRMLAVALWFGIGDLHSLNVALVQDQRTGLTNLVPIDIEMIFNEVRLLSQSGLLASPKTSFDSCGLSLLHAHLTDDRNEKVFELVSGLLTQWHGLLAVDQEITTTLRNLPELLSTPLRVVPRATKFYMHLLADGGDRTFLTASEKDQLRRGDIPYYFRFGNSKDLFWINSSGDFAEADFPDNFFESKDPQFTRVQSYLELNRSQTDGFVAALQLLRNYHSKNDGIIDTELLSISCKTGELQIRFRDKACSCKFV